MNLGKRIKQASKSLYLTDSFITLCSLCQELAHLGLTVFSSCKLKTGQDERQGIKLPLETIAFYSDSFVARKINIERKVAENWAPYFTDLHFDIKPNSAKKCII